MRRAVPGGRSVFGCVRILVLSPCGRAAHGARARMVAEALAAAVWRLQGV
ncbi:hypothetical protein Rsph17029_1408 [Rhodobacter sphaeroides ATCC 17029]|nr:hypothetical protein Rsph17029_1408 [Cereibacter sphaeroides ATCC 17029]